VAINISGTSTLVWFSPDGVTWHPSGNPATNTGGFALSSLTSAIAPAASLFDATDEWTLNFSGPFAHAIPSGFAAWGSPPEQLQVESSQLTRDLYFQFGGTLAGGQQSNTTVTQAGTLLANG